MTLLDVPARRADGAGAAANTVPIERGLPSAQRDATPEGRRLIINGEDAPPDLFPFFAYIGWGGGALVAPDMVLTAGHCLPEGHHELDRMKVQVGKYHRKRPGSSAREGRGGDRRLSSRRDDDTGDRHRNDDVDDDVVGRKDHYDDDDNGKHHDGDDRRGKDDDGSDDKSKHSRDSEPDDDGYYFRDDDPNVETFHVARAIRHPMFETVYHGNSEDEYVHDYLLLKLDGRSKAPVVSINRNPHLPRSGDELTVAGMGWIQPGWPDVFPEVLQQVQLEYLPNDQCARSEGRGMRYRHKIQDSHLCTTGGPHNARDACAYDSGSPILMPARRGGGGGGGGGNGPFVLVGTVSWGEDCADPDFPGVNARTSLASDWIDAVVCEYSDDPPADFRCDQRSRIFGPALSGWEGRAGDVVVVGLLLAAMVLLVRRWQARRTLAKDGRIVSHPKLDGFKPLQRQGSTYSYDSVGSAGVEIIT